MSDSDFEHVFGGGAAAGRANFAERLGRTDPARANGAAASVETAGSGTYKPYGFLPTGTINEAFHLTSWVPGTLIKESHSFPYRLLLETASGEAQLKLHLPTGIVVIDGKNLLDLHDKIWRKQVTFIAEYSSKVWPDRPPQGEPIIEKITIVRPDGAK